MLITITLKKKTFALFTEKIKRKKIEYFSLFFFLCDFDDVHEIEDSTLLVRFIYLFMIFHQFVNYI